MSTTAPASATASPTLGAPGASGIADAREPIPSNPAVSAAHDDAAAAALSEVVLVSLTDVRQVGAEAAVVWALIQSGCHDYGDLVRATRLTRRDVRANWALLARRGFILPENSPTAAEASAMVGASTHD